MISIRNHFIFAGIIITLLFAFISVFKSILLPFVLAFGIAYLLEPIMRTITSFGLKRWIAALIILSLFTLSALLIVIAVLPIVYQESLSLSADLPQVQDKISTYLSPLYNNIKSYIGHADNEEIKALFFQHVGTATTIGRNFLNNLLAGGQAFVGFISTLVITPIVAYFIMKDWPHITHWILDLMPKDQKNTLNGLLQEIDAKISGFVRGQISVAFILAIFYALALSIAGLKYGVLFGLLAGFLNIIPMLGSAVGLLIGALMAWLQSGDLMFTGIIAGIFIFGQIIEGNFLTPKLVGDSVGMHPLWIFFALMAGGALFGILGMMLAIPIVAIAGVLIVFAISQYKSSAYYKGKARKKSKAKPQKNKS